MLHRAFARGRFAIRLARLTLSRSGSRVSKLCKSFFSTTALYRLLNDSISRVWSPRTPPSTRGTRIKERALMFRRIIHKRRKNLSSANSAIHTRVNGRAILQLPPIVKLGREHEIVKHGGSCLIRFTDSKRSTPGERVESVYQIVAIESLH